MVCPTALEERGAEVMGKRTWYSEEPSLPARRQKAKSPGCRGLGCRYRRLVLAGPDWSAVEGASGLALRKSALCRVSLTGCISVQRALCCQCPSGLSSLARICLPGPRPVRKQQSAREQAGLPSGALTLPRFALSCHSQARTQSAGLQHDATSIAVCCSSTRLQPSGPPVCGGAQP